jgi:hypothetical protein
VTPAYIRLRHFAIKLIGSIGTILNPVFPTASQRIILLIAALGQARRKIIKWKDCVYPYFQHVNPDISKELIQVLSKLKVSSDDTLLIFVDEKKLAKALPAPRFGWISAHTHQKRISTSLCKFVGEMGTVVLPCDSIENPKKLSHDRSLYNSRHSQATGLAGQFQRLQGVYRSAGPLLSLAAYGRDAKQLMSGQLDAAPFPMGEKSPWEKLLNQNTKVIIIGWGTAHNLSLLLPIHMDHANYPRPSFFHRPFVFKVIDENKDERTVEFHIHARLKGADYNLAAYADYAKYSRHLDEKYKIYTKDRVGELEIAVFDYAKQYECVRNEMSEGIFLEDTRYL